MRRLPGERVRENDHYETAETIFIVLSFSEGVADMAGVGVGCGGKVEA